MCALATCQVGLCEYMFSKESNGHMRFKASKGRYQFSSIRTIDRILSVLKDVYGETRRREQWLSLAGGSLPYWKGNVRGHSP